MTSLAMILPYHRHWCAGGGLNKVNNELPPHLAHSWLCYSPVCNEGKYYICGLWADRLICCRNNKRIKKDGTLA